MEKHALQSKVNWAQIAVVLIGVVVTADILPAKYEEGLTQLALLGVPPLTIAFRTWWTSRPLRVGRAR